MTCYSFLGRGFPPPTMVGLGRAAMLPLGIGPGHSVFPSFPLGSAKAGSPASEPPAPLHSEASYTGIWELINY